MSLKSLKPVIDAEGVEITLPTRNAICPTCDGEGTHVNRAIDGNGLTAEDLADEDFRESYMSGAYDVPCEECRGRRVVREVDKDRLTPELRHASREGRMPE